MTELIRPCLYDAWHEIVPLTQQGRPPQTYDVVGPVCETSDTFARERELPRCEAGDLLMIRTTGAYGASMASNFNSRPLAKEVGRRMVFSNQVGTASALESDDPKTTHPHLNPPLEGEDFKAALVRVAKAHRLSIFRIARFLSLALAFCGTAAHAAVPNTNANSDYDRLVDAVIARYHLPGIAVGVIENGKVVYTRTIGQLESGKPIDADTLFQIASNTKAMTVTLLARLVQEGKLRWDDPVTKYLPAFRMYDPWVTKNMQVADLLAHHSGLSLGAGDLMLWPEPNHFTPRDVVKALRYFRPAYGFRAGYAYDNTLYIVAGQVAAAAGDAPYATLLRREVFQPLGMHRCQIGTWNRDEVGNVAPPYIYNDGHFIAEPANGSIEHAATMDSAGGVWCSLDDMLTWAMSWLAPTPQQLAWLSPAERRGEWAIYTPMPISKRRHAWDGTIFYGNGHGWRIADVDGQMTVSHTGTLSGMYSAVTLLPFRKSGFVFLINADAENARLVLNEVLTKHFTAPDKARSVASYADELARADRQQRISRVPDTSSRQPATPVDLKHDLGVWHDPWFGEVRICAKGNTVQFASQKSPMLTGEVIRVGKQYLVHWDHGDAEAWLRFPTHIGGTLHMAKVDPDADFSYDYQDLAFTREHGCD